ncbi:MAG: S-methyl-5'-thioadenosine phosphorylase [Planctomycetes bacterium]|nr:S-methyl-5'-thioadenosine phosphorylase [Planctomycetota bacterium]
MSKAMIGIIGGSGLGDSLVRHITNVKHEDIDTPFGKPSAPIIVGQMGGKEIAFLNRHGEGHTFCPTTVPYAANIFALKKLGVTTLIASGAVGSLRQKIAPKDLIVVDQFIDKTTQRKNSFFTDFGAVHCDFSHPCCDRLRNLILSASENIHTKTHEFGTYVCMEGPQFSTRAESLMHKSWEADLIGMTAMPEAKLAREAQMCYSLIALASDYDCWKGHDPSIGKRALLAEIIGNLTAATANAIELIEAVLNTDGTLCSEQCQCRKSLKLAVWTKPKSIDPEKKKQLAPLFQ